MTKHRGNQFALNQDLVKLLEEDENGLSIKEIEDKLGRLFVKEALKFLIMTNSISSKSEIRNGHRKNIYRIKEKKKSDNIWIDG